ncbi:MAG TPA: M56 family metallopeptidase [Thermoanaerobaculia bacterium]
MSGIESLWAHPAVQAIAWALVHFLWQGALVGLAAAGILALLKNGSASLRYSVALGVLLVLLLCPLGTALWMSGTGGEKPLVREASPAVVIAGAPVQDAPVLSSNARDLLPAALPWFFALWLAGVAVLSVYHLGGWAQARRWTRRVTRPLPEEWQAKLCVLARRLGVGREVGLLESASAQVPAVIGWLRPVILIPASTLTGLSPQQLEAVLAHELAHVRRHDYLVNLLQTVVETLLFYHPAVWWVSAQARRERENCCDDLAVAVCGDRLVYVRALADLEGLRVSSPRFAMAADGGSLVARIRRLAGVPARDSRRSWLAGVLALSLLPAGFALYVSSSVLASADQKEEGRTSRSGTWTLEKKTGDLFKIKMEMKWPGSHWVTNTEVHANELKGLATGSNVRFEMPRDPGTFHFQGSFDGEDGKGTFTFQGNPEYARQMRSLGYEVSDSKLLELYVHDISLEFARAMTALGKISIDKLVELRIHNVSPEYIREMAGLGYRGLSADKLVEFKIHGVSPALVRALVDSGYADLPPDRVVEFKIHGVTPDYIRGLAKAGYRDVEPERLVEMKIHGITPAYVQGVVDAGYRNLPPSRLVEFKIHGIDGKFIRDAANRGYKNLTPGELVDLKLMGRLDHRREG